MALQNQLDKVENGGINRQGRLSAEEYVELVEEVIDLGDAARVGEVDGTGIAVIDESTGQVVDMSLYATKAWVENFNFLVESSLKTINGQSLVGIGNISLSGGDGTGGDVNVIEAITVNGSVVTPDANKVVNIVVPTALSGLTEDSSHRLVTDAEKDLWSSKTSNIGTVTSVTVNGSNHTPDAYGVVNLGTISGGAGADTKNTAGATTTTLGTGEKFYLIGAKEQTANPQTYTLGKAYISEDGYLNANGVNVDYSLTKSTFARVLVLMGGDVELFGATFTGPMISAANATDYSWIVSGNTNLQEELDSLAAYAVPVSTKGVASGVCPLNASGKINNSFMPSMKTINSENILGSGSISVVTNIVVNGQSYSPSNGTVNLGTISGGSSSGGGGDANIIEIIKVNGSVLSVDSNKAVDITAIPASIVTQDATHRFVTDAEKSAWDAKPSTDTDTKNTAGATDITLNTGEKVYLVGAKEQTANPQTYSKDCLYFTPTGFTCGFLNADIGEQTSLGAEANNCISINNVMGVRSIGIVSPGAVGIQGGIIGLSANNINVTNGGVIYMTSATDFSDIRAGSSSSYTSLQSVLDAKVTSVRVNGTSYSPTNGVVDLGTISGGGSGGSSVTFRVW